MELVTIMKFGYTVVIVTFLLMIWVSLSFASLVDHNQNPPCYFNQLCSCSKFVPDLGIVSCQNTQLPQIPQVINTSKVFVLHLENNGLRTLPPYFFHSTGLYKIVVRKNPLHYIPDESFMGLERTLWELDLSYDTLVHVPNRSLRYLQKLKLLDLTGNDIVSITPDNWRGLESSLETLILKDNAITDLPIDAFSGLPMVETIDLRGNNLKEIDPAVFRDGMGKLSRLLLGDNLLTAIPYQAISPLKTLRVLDLTHNRINNMKPGVEIGVQNINLNIQLTLDELHLDYNSIRLLEAVSFQYFNLVNKTFLNGNPLRDVEDNAFRQARIRELYLRDCQLSEITPEALSGLENSLEILDLSGNNISLLPAEVFGRLSFLKFLSLRENFVSVLNPAETFSGFQFSLHQLDYRGSHNVPAALQDFRRLRNLRVLKVSRLKHQALSPDDFIEYGVDLEKLHISGGNLQSIKNNAFQYVHGLKLIDLSENSITTVEPNAFKDIGHSLLYLKMSHSLSSSMQNLPSESLKSLTNIEELDFSNNRLKNVPDTSFHFMKNLRLIELQDNVIDTLHKGTFQSDYHSSLEDVNYSFNNIKNILQHTFVDLPRLKYISLDDNRIENIERRSFMNLPNLAMLNLEGNKLKSLPFETFQNLPKLENLDMSYNELETFHFGIFDQVGTLSVCKVNISHNKLSELKFPGSSSFDGDLGSSGFHSNIKVLDLSHNNISVIRKYFFKPAEISLSHIYISHNELLNITRETFGNTIHLQLLDFSHNSITEIDYDSFRNTKNLQVLIASHNEIVDLPGDLFRTSFSLRIVDFSNNRLRSLPDNMFREHGLERLDLSNNLLGKLPLNSLSIAAASTLVELDLSWNSISSLSHGGILTRFQSLSMLDLSYNRLAQIDGGTFKGLPKISCLNLAHNIQLALESNGLSFQGLEYSLLTLNLDNTSLSHFPLLPSRGLVELSVAYNYLPTVPVEVAGNLSVLTKLNLDFNDLTSIPLVTHSLPELRYLSLEANPITTLSNTSLLGVAGHLKQLNIQLLPLTILEGGTLCKLTCLRTLMIDTYKEVKNFNIPRIIQFNNGLRNLEINVLDDSNLYNVMNGNYPTKVRNVTFTGRGLKNLHDDLLQGIRSPVLHLGIHNTSVTKVSANFFRNSGRAVNISIDVSNNDELKSIGNPSSGMKPNLPRETFLTDVVLHGNKWQCDCDIGWIEVWLRKQRQYLCLDSVEGSDVSPYDETRHRCRQVDDDMRNAFCANKKNQSLIEVLKTDIECGWSSSVKIEVSIYAVLPLIMILVFRVL